MAKTKKNLDWTRWESKNRGEFFMIDWTSSDTCDIVNTMAAGNGWITPVRLSAECYDKHFAVFSFGRQNGNVYLVYSRVL